MVVELNAYTAGGGGGGGGGAEVDTTPTYGAATAVPTNAETTVVSRVVPGGWTMKLDGLIATGSADAEWFIYDDATRVAHFRTSGAQRSKEIPFDRPIPFATGHTCAIKAVHLEPSVQNFYGTILSHDE